MSIANRKKRFYHFLKMEFRITGNWVQISDTAFRLWKRPNSENLPNLYVGATIGRPAAETIDLADATGELEALSAGIAMLCNTF